MKNRIIFSIEDGGDETYTHSTVNGEEEAIITAILLFAHAYRLAKMLGDEKGLSKRGKAKALEMLKEETNNGH
jgi:hypothetical protein